MSFETDVQTGNRSLKFPNADRVIAPLRALEGNIALFSHGHFGRVLAARWIGLEIWHTEHLLLSTASVSILGYEHKLAEVPAIVLWNAVSKEALTYTKID